MRTLLHNAWARFAVRLSAIAVCILALVAATLSAAYWQASRRTIEQFSQSKAQQVASHLDSAVQTVFSYAYAIYNDSDVFQWLYHTAPDAYLDVRMTLAVRRYVNSEALLGDVCLYNFRRQRAYSSRQGILALGNAGEQPLTLLALDGRSGLFELTPLATPQGERLVMAYPTSLIERAYEARMLLLVDTRVLEKDVLGASSSEEQIFVVDASRQVLLGNAPSDADALLVAAGTDSPVDSAWAVNGTLMTVCQMNNQPWKVCHVMRVLPFGSRMEGFFRILVVALLSALALLVGLLVLQSWRTLGPYEPIVRRVSQGQQPGKRGKTALLRESVDSLLENLDSMRASLGDHDMAIRAEEWRRWLITGSEQALSGLLPAQSMLTLAVVRIEGYFNLRASESYTRRVLLKSELAQYFGRLAAQSGLSVDAMDGGEDRVIFFSRDMRLRQALETLCQGAAEQVGVSVSAAISDPEPPSNLRAQALIDQLHAATYLSFFLEERRVFTQRDYEQYQAMLRPTNNNALLNELIDALRSAQPEAWQAALAALVESWRAIPYADVRFYAKLTAHAISITFAKLLSPGDAETVGAALGQASRLSELQAKLCDLCVRVTAGLTDARQPTVRWQDTLLEAMDYIATHLQELTLSPDTVATHVGLSTNYLRKLFKESYDESLSDYIRRQRLEKAMRLLAGTRMTVGEIMEYVGSANRSSFFQSFKRSTGMTPEQYRARYADGESGSLPSHQKRYNGR